MSKKASENEIQSSKKLNTSKRQIYQRHPIEAGKWKTEKEWDRDLERKPDKSKQYQKWDKYHRLKIKETVQGARTTFLKIKDLEHYSKITRRKIKIWFHS